MANTVQSFEELNLHALQDIYDAEQQALKALPQLMEAASAQELKAAFQQHMQETKGQVQRLEQIFDMMGQKPQGKTCVAMQGLIKEAQEIIKMQGDPTVKDAGLIAAAQKQEHYEIAAYGTARTWAQMLGQQQAAQLFEQTLKEEEATDKKLTMLAENSVNMRAAQ